MGGFAQEGGKFPFRSLFFLDANSKLGPVMVFIWSERSARSRPPSKNVAKQPLPPKKCREASTTKICHKAAPPKNAASKYAVNAALLKKCCEAALQKVPCYV